MATSTLPRFALYDEMPSWIKRFPIETNGTVTVTVSNAFRGVIVATGMATNSHGMWIFCTSNSGSPALTEIKTASYVTTATSTNTLTITSGTSSSRIDVFVVALDGSVTS